MKTTKTFITALLVAAVVVSQCAAPSATAFAGTTEMSGTESVQEVSGESVKLALATTSDGFEYSISGNEATITGYSGSATSITIPDTLDGKPVTSIGQAAFGFCYNLKSVTIPDSVTSIGWGAFSCCSGLTSVTIGKNVKTIEADAFGECTSLTGITIPKSVTSIGAGAFSDCTSLTKFKVKSGNKYYSAKGGALYSADQKTLVCYPSATGAVKIKSGVKTIGEAAFQYTTITSVTMGKSVTKIADSAFDRCLSLTDVTIGSKVKSIGYDAFYWCLSLTNIIIPDSVKTIGASAFELCECLTVVSIPESVTTIGEEAFSYCYSLTDVYYAGSQSDWNAISIDSGNENLTGSSYAQGANIHYNSEVALVDGAVYQVTSSENHKVEYLFCSGATGAIKIPATISIGGTTYKVTSIADSAFSGNTDITSVTVGNKVATIGKNAFLGCTKLTSVTLGKGVKKIKKNAFKNCTSIKTVTIKSEKITAVAAGAFLGVSSNAKIKVPSAMLSKYKKLIQASGFAGKVETL